MWMTVANNIKSTIPRTESAKEYMELIKERFLAEPTLMGTLSICKFDGTCTMH